MLIAPDTGRPAIRRPTTAFCVGLTHHRRFASTRRTTDLVPLPSQHTAMAKQNSTASPDRVLERAVDLVRRQCDLVPKVAVVLGSGLGGVADRIDAVATIPFDSLPGFAASTAAGHRGQLILGHIDGVAVVAMAGRLHRYEGHRRDAIVFPIQLMAQLGAETLIVSNAAGGIDPRLNVGDIVLIDSHIDWIHGGPNRTDTAVSGVLHRQPQIYDPQLMQWASDAAVADGFAMQRGTYLATTGPTYETRAEYRMMRRIGADLAGMSTVPETIAGASMGMRVLALSMVSNVANPDQPQAASHEEVLQAGRQAAGKLESVVRCIVSKHRNQTSG
ncbi:Purine nucleoside phosphorylase 1 [Crateriforma conspicua]|uniref:purine-nucleoside phosphorylase n=1 Tax=Crateriforma conspicua TaxID=2527996 RepID=A0A5C6FT45_9PLAN|nr:purine-nucleoside phosphorylase [Crateriforma conspicua]TWU63361.1 Purine nucleoside phosphorylase 1 [Crateriforma conspicua]